MSTSGKATGAGGGSALEHVKIRGSAIQAIVDGTNTQAALDTLVGLDPFGYFNAATPGRLTVPAGHGGTFLILGMVQFAPLAGGGRYIKPRLNGANLNPQPSLPGSAVVPVVLDFLMTVALAAGDFIDLLVYSDAGAAAQVDFGLPQSPSLAMARLGA